MNRLLLKITYKCTSRCRHCLYCSSARSDDASLTPSDVERFIQQAHPAECVIFTGGEASLEPELVLHGIGIAKSIGVDSWLVSNGSWGKNPRRAGKFARAMKAAGLSRASISVDALHQEFVPIDSALGALRALRSAGVENLKAIVTFVDRERALPIDRLTEELVDGLGSEPGIGIDIRPRVSFTGRAISELAPYASKLTLFEALNSEDGCEEESKGSLRPRSFYDVGPDGRIFICAGFSFPGNLRSMEFEDIIDEKNIFAHPLASAFHAATVRGLLNVAILHDYIPLKYYLSRCHLCWDVRNYLRPHYPDVLTPPHAYSNGYQ